MSGSRRRTWSFGVLAALASLVLSLVARLRSASEDEPDLFSDAVHNTFEGLGVRAWIVFEELLPSIRQDIRSGRLPSAWVETPEPHPYISPPYVQRFSAEAAPVEGAPPSWQSEGDDPAGRY